MFGSNQTSTFQMRVIFHFQPFFQLDLRWPLTSVCDLDLINIWRFPFYIHKPSLVPIGLKLFKRDPNMNFLFSTFLPTWPQMTLDLGTRVRQFLPKRKKPRFFPRFFPPGRNSFFQFLPLKFGRNSKMRWNSVFFACLSKVSSFFLTFMVQSCQIILN